MSARNQALRAAAEAQRMASLLGDELLTADAALNDEEWRRITRLLTEASTAVRYAHNALVAASDASRKAEQS